MTERIPLPYRYTEIRRLCQRIVHSARLDGLCGHRLKILDVRPFQMNDDWNIGMHMHSFYEAHLFLRGNAYYTHRDTQDIVPGSLVFHPPYMPHSWRTTSDLGPVLLLVFSFTFQPAVRVPVPAKWPVRPELISEVEALLDDARDMRPGWRDRVTFRLGLLLSRITACADWPKEESPRSETDDLLVDVVDQFLKDNIARQVTISDVAAHVGMSVSSLAHHYNSLTGVSVMKRLFGIRMDKAADLLVDTEISMAEIATQVGMPEPSYFGRRFRQYFAMTPASYRRGITLPTVTESITEDE